MKNEEYNIDEILDELNQQSCDYLTEEDFYPPSDNRCLKSNISDISGGDNFTDYCEYIFEILDEEEYYE